MVDLFSYDKEGVDITSSEVFLLSLLPTVEVTMSGKGDFELESGRDVLDLNCERCVVDAVDTFD